MTLRHLKIFISVCDTGSFTKAAEQLNMTQPAVSSAIKDLEYYYNANLFDRLNKKIYITEAGEILLKSARQIMQQLDNTAMQIKNPAHTSHLKIGCNVSLAYSYFPQIVSTFTKDHPNVQIESYVANSNTIEQKLLRHELDFALVDNLTISPHFKSKLISREKMIVVCGKDYYNSTLENFTIDTLKQHKFLLREKGSGLRNTIDDIFENLNITPQIAMESTSTTALINAAIHNLGITIIPENLIKDNIHSDKLVQIHLDTIEFLRHYFLIYHKDKYLSESMKAFLTHCTNV